MQTSVDGLRQARLFPQLPPEDKPAFCFYPMSKRRSAEHNWYSLDFESRKELMMGHGRVGRTFQYTATGPVGLATGKKAYIFTSSGGIYSEGPAAAYDYLSTYLRTALGFIGITDISFIQTEGVSRGDEALANALAKTRASIAALAA